MVSGDDPTLNYVQLPMDTTVWNDGFTQDDYKALVKGTGRRQRYQPLLMQLQQSSLVDTVAITFLGNIK